MGAERYFLEAEPSLAAKLDGFISRLAGDLVQQSWHSGVTLVLAGGYGRGEGGVFRTSEDAQAELYNDLEFYLFFPGATPEGARTWVARWEHDGTAELGIDVEFKILGADALQAAEPTMFFHDLVAGHRHVAGEHDLLKRCPASLRNAAALPLEEVNRLLFNRGSGLLFARWHLEKKDASDLGFVERNHAKARLALADAVLAAAGRHHASVLERARRIAAGGFPVPSVWDELRSWHEEGVAFKLRPRHRHPALADLRQASQVIEAAWLRVFLWLEEQRLGRNFASASDYAVSSGRLFPRTSRLRNVALRVRDQLHHGEFVPAWTDYPRAALLRALLSTLGGGNEVTAERLLGVKPGNFRAAYRRWWSRYN